MKPSPTYVVLAARGAGWESHGPIASEYPTLEQAEAAASELSARYPNRVLGVYELQTVFGTEQRVVKQQVKAPERPIRRKADIAAPENIVQIRAAN